MRFIRGASAVFAMPKRKPVTATAGKPSSKRQKGRSQLRTHIRKISSTAVGAPNPVGSPAAAAEQASVQGLARRDSAGAVPAAKQPGVQRVAKHASRQQQQQQQPRAGAQQDSRHAGCDGLHEIRVMSVRQAQRGSGWSASFKQQFLDAGWQVRRQRVPTPAQPLQWGMLC